MLIISLWFKVVFACVTFDLRGCCDAERCVSRHDSCQSQVWVHLVPVPESSSLLQFTQTDHRRTFTVLDSNKVVALQSNIILYTSFHKHIAFLIISNWRNTQAETWYRWYRTDSFQWTCWIGSQMTLNDSFTNRTDSTVAVLDSATHWFSDPVKTNLNGVKSKLLMPGFSIDYCK